MSTIAEIVAAIQNLPQPQVDELAAWLDELRIRRRTPQSVESWLSQARGAACPGTKTDVEVSITRAED